MLFVSDYDVIQGLDRILIGIFSISLVIGAISIGLFIFTKKIPKADIKTSKQYLLGIALFAIMTGVGRLVLYIHDYFAPDTLDQVLWRLGSLIILIGLVCLIFIIETYVNKKTKYLLTLLGIICALLLIFMPKTIATISIYAAMITLMLIPFLIYLNIFKKTTGIVKKMAFYIIVGFLLIFIGQFGGAMLFEMSVFSRAFSQIFGILLSLAGLITISFGLIGGSIQKS